MCSEGDADLQRRVCTLGVVAARSSRRRRRSTCLTVELHAAHVEVNDDHWIYVGPRRMLRTLFKLRTNIPPIAYDDSAPYEQQSDAQPRRWYPFARRTRSPVRSRGSPVESVRDR
jgi:hypothetical protein